MNEKESRLLNSIKSRIGVPDKSEMLESAGIAAKNAVAKLEQMQLDATDQGIVIACAHLKLRVEANPALARAVLQDSKTGSGMMEYMSDRAYHYLKDVKKIGSLQNRMVTLGDTLAYKWAEEYFFAEEKTPEPQKTPTATVKAKTKTKSPEKDKKKSSKKESAAKQEDNQISLSDLFKM